MTHLEPEDHLNDPLDRPIPADRARERRRWSAGKASQLLAIRRTFNLEKGVADCRRSRSGEGKGKGKDDF